MVGEVVLLLYVWMMNVNQVRCYIFDIECPETWETGTQAPSLGALYIGVIHGRTTSVASAAYIPPTYVYVHIDRVDSYVGLTASRIERVLTLLSCRFVL